MNSHNPVNGGNYLALGILSLVFCPLLGPLAWSMSSNALNSLDQYELSGEDISQRGLVEAGRICGMIGTAFLGLTLCLVLLRATETGYTPENGPGMTTITVDGHPASPAEQRAIEEQINKAPAPQPGSQSPAGAPK